MSANPLSASNGLLATLRREVTEYLAAFEDLQNPVTVPVIDGGKTNLLDAVDDALLKRTAGLCLVVTTPRVEPGEEGPRSVSVTVSIQIYEHPLKNWSPKGAQRSPEDTGELLLARLLWTEAGVEGWSPSATWTPLEFTGLRPVFASTEQVVFEATFTTRTIIRIG